MSTQNTYRVELERLDHGYEARVPSLNNCLCVGLTEGETLRRLHDVLGMHLQASGAPVTHPGSIRFEVFRT